MTGKQSSGAPSQGSGTDTTARDQVAQTRTMAPPGPAGRMAMAGMPVERSANFGASTRRLVARLRPERTGIVAVVVLAVTATVLSVSGPKILGRATDIVFDGLRNRQGQQGIDYSQLHKVLWFAVALYVTSSAIGWLQSYLLAGAVQRTMFTLRTEVEDKLNRLPLNYVDRQPRGDLLSRATNDIDNVAQSLQQTISMMLTSTLTLVGVLIMMFTISWELALIAALSIPASLRIVKMVSKIG